MDISYGVLDYNPSSDPAAFNLLAQCLQSLAENRSPRFQSEVFVIEQGNQDPDYCSRVAALCRKYQFEFFSLNTNVGISRGINYIYQLARGSIVSLVTSDVVFFKDTDQVLMDELDQNSKLYQVTPCVNTSSLPYQTSDGVTGAELTRCIANELTVQFWRTEAFDEIGFWDERWKACYENNDWTLRLFLAGFDTAISFNCFCHHNHSTTTKNGSIKQSYDGYLEMKDGLDHRVLRKMWNEKWEGLDWHFMYNPGRLNDDIRARMAVQFKHNIWLDRLQDVAY